VSNRHNVRELNVSVLLTLCCDGVPTSFWCCILRGDCASVVMVTVECTLHFWVESEAFWNMTPCGLVSSFIFRVYFVNCCWLWKWSSCLLKLLTLSLKLCIFAPCYLWVCMYAWFVWCVYAHECPYVCVRAFELVCVNIIIEVNRDPVTSICLCRQCLLLTTMPFPSVQCHGNLQ
jgi:hypothetical protein